MSMRRKTLRPRREPNELQLRTLASIYAGSRLFEQHDRRTLNALERRKLVRYYTHHVAITAAGKRLLFHAK